MWTQICIFISTCSLESYSYSLNFSIHIYECNGRSALYTHMSLHRVLKVFS